MKRKMWDKLYYELADAICYYVCSTDTWPVVERDTYVWYRRINYPVPEDYISRWNDTYWFLSPDTELVAVEADDEFII